MIFPQNKFLSFSLTLFNAVLIAFFVLFLIFGFSQNAHAYNIEGSGVCNCNTCADCTNALNDNTDCASTVKLTADFNSTGTCLDNPSLTGKTLDGQNYTITGNGTGYFFYSYGGQSDSTIQNMTIKNFSVSIRNQANNIIIQNINFIDNMGSPTIQIFPQVSNVSVYNCSFTNLSGSGIYFHDCINCTITGCTGENIIANMIVFGIATDVLIEDCSYEGTSGGSEERLLLVQSYDNVTVNNCDSNGGFYGMSFEGYTCSGLTVTNCTISNSIHGGLYYKGGGATFQNNDIDNFDFSGYTNFGKNALIRDNNIGIFELKGGDNNTIIYNNISGRFTAASYDSGSSIGPDANDNNISFNTFTTTDNAIMFFSTYGSSGNIISSNTFDSSNVLTFPHTAVGIHNSTNNTIEDNNALTSAGFLHLDSNTSGSKGCGNIGTITDAGANYVSNTSQSCYIWDCEDLNNTGRLGSNGTYLLGQAISNNSGSCMTFSANDLTLNCQDNIIDGNGTGTGVSFSSVANETLSNCTLTDFANKYNLANSTNIDLNGDFTFSGSANSMDFNVSDSLIDIDYQGSVLGGLSLTKINRAINLNNNDVVSMLITPVSGLIDLVIDTWNIATTYYKKWTETGDGSTGNTAHTIGDLRAGQYYQVKADSSVIETLQADGSGQISFTYSGGYSDKEFEVEEIPLAPTIGSPAVLSSTSIRWNFTDNADNETGFRVYDDTDTLVSSSATADLTYLDEIELSENTQYTGRYATAYNTYGNSLSSSTASSIYTLIQTPTAISFDDIGVNALTVSATGTLSNLTSGTSGLYFDETSGEEGGADSAWLQTNLYQNTGLSENTQYTYRVKARNGDSAETSYTAISSQYTLASQTNNLTANNATDKDNYKINLSWTNQGQTGIKIEQDTNCDGYETTLYDNASTNPSSPYQISANANTCYKFRISSYNGDGILNTNSIPETSEITTPPAQPQNLTHTANTINSITWNWDDVNTATGYKVYDGNDNLLQTIASAVSTWTQESLLADTQYIVYVRSTNSNGQGIASSSASAYTSANIPTNASHSANTTSSIVWDWQSGGAEKDFYAWTTAPSANFNWGTSTSWNQSSDISTNTQYTFYVKARNEDLDETNSVSHSAYSSQNISAGISFDNVGENSITVSAQGTFSNLSFGSSGLYFLNTTNSDTANWLQTNSWTNSSLNPNTQYTYQAKSRNGDGDETSYCPIFSKYTLANTPTNLTGTSEQNTMDLSVDSFVNDTAGSSGYYFENTTKGTNSGWVQANFWNDAGLTCNTSYAYTVKYRNGDGTETETISLTQSTDSCGGGSTPIGSQNPPEPPVSNPENPKGELRILINNGDEATNNRTVNLKLSAGSDTTKMIISENSDFKSSIEEPYQETRQWSLSCGDGIKTVYVKFYTKYGIESEIISDSIILGAGLKKEIKPIKPEIIIENKPVEKTPLPEKDKSTSLPKTSIKENIALNPIAIVRNLKYGSNNNQVINLQDKLKQLNLFPKEIKSNGNFGPATIQAVKEFQKSVGIYPCGIVGPRTRKALNNQEFITNKDYQFTKDLGYNNKGEEVKQLQTRLRDQSFFPHYVKSTGWFGPITKKAVKLFQKFHGIIENGIVGELVRGRLNL